MNSRSYDLCPVPLIDGILDLPLVGVEAMRAARGLPAVSLILDEGLGYGAGRCEAGQREAVAAAQAVRDEFAAQAGMRWCTCAPEPAAPAPVPERPRPPSLVDGHVTPEWMAATIEYWREESRQWYKRAPGEGIDASWWMAHERDAPAWWPHG